MMVYMQKEDAIDSRAKTIAGETVLSEKLRSDSNKPCEVYAQKEEYGLDSLAKTIAGEIVLSENPGNAIQKWRNIFKIPQRQLADKMTVMPSVISDYESGRRKSPGIQFIKRIVNALLEIDRTTGGVVSKEFQSLYSNDVLSDAILDIKDYPKSVSLSNLAKSIDGMMEGYVDEPDKMICGHTMIDSLKAIMELSQSELTRLYGLTTEKAMIITNVSSGKTALVAIKVTNLKPSVVIFHGIKEVDPLAVRIAKTEKIPILLSKMKTVDELISALKIHGSKEKQ